MSGRREIPFQNHIINSYKNCGGHAKKWASEWQKGVPDLIASLSGFGVHLAEVKHRPTFGKVAINNPLEEKQVLECRQYVESGGLVVGYLVSGEKAIKSRLYIFDPLCEKVIPSCPFVDYVLSEKFDVRKLLRSFLETR